MAGRVQDKVAIVTGAGSVGPGWSNGKAAAVLYAREGAKILAADVNLESVQETASIIADEGGQCTAVHADVSDAEAVNAMVAKCIDTYGSVDILHNNVGITEVGGPEEIDEEGWDRVMDVNVKSMYLTCKVCLPHMVRQGAGAIVNISSIAATHYIYPCLSYSASKGAINQLTQNIALQYADKGIRANTVMPGFMHTPMVEKFVTSAYGGGIEEMVAKRSALVPMKRMGDAWDVAHAALFLASDEAGYITGANIVVDGGITCKT